MKAHWLYSFACALVLLLGASPAAAQGADSQRFVPAAGAGGGFLVERAVLPSHLGFGAGLFVNYADDSLILKSRASGDNLSRIVDNALALDLLGSIGLFDHLGIALHLPVALWQDGDPYSTLGSRLQAGAGLGDLRLVPKGVFYRTTTGAVGIALGAALPITFPTGDSEALRGADAFTFEPRFLFGVLGERWSVSTSLGVRLRTSTGDDNLVGHELSFGVGGAVSVIPRRDLLDLLIELVGSGDLAKSKPAATGVPLELIGGAVVKPHPSWHLYAGGGLGLVDGLGCPDFRLILGLRYQHRPAEPYRDTDGDGIANRNDRCPTQPEDFDGFQDQDGCPDQDNDHDGIADNDDECPEVAEERGGDGDGCPDKGQGDRQERQDLHHRQGPVRGGLGPESGRAASSFSTRWPPPSESTPSSARSASRGIPTTWATTVSTRS